MAGNLKGREILLGVSASIAAYKAAELVRLFRQEGAGVSCVLTPSATKFITPLTLAALSGRPASQDVLNENEWGMAHLSLAKSADAVLIAPCTADLLAQFAAGTSDNLLSAAVLATRAPVFIAPAMHEPMWTHPATQRNVKTCLEFGYRFIGPVKGPLASGDSGLGRMEDPAQIVSHLTEALMTTKRTVSRK